MKPIEAKYTTNIGLIKKKKYPKFKVSDHVEI